MTQKEAIDAVDATIFNKPSGLTDERIVIFISKEIADHLVDSFRQIVNYQFTPYKNKGDTFLWKGIKCIVT